MGFVNTDTPMTEAACTQSRFTFYFNKTLMKINKDELNVAVIGMVHLLLYPLSLDYDTEIFPTIWKIRRAIF